MKANRPPREPLPPFERGLLLLLCAFLVAALLGWAGAALVRLWFAQP